MPATDDESDLTVLTAQVAPGAARLDRALADALPELSRARIQALLDAGAVSLNGAVVGAKAKPAPGDYHIILPPWASAELRPEDIPLTIPFEVDDLIARIQYQ